MRLIAHVLLLKYIVAARRSTIFKLYAVVTDHIGYTYFMYTQLLEGRKYGKLLFVVPSFDGCC